MSNRLEGSLSSYLRQHANNPVDWHQWGAEAFDEARRRDVPVLLSVGYAACHWCHVMAHESFEDPEVAALMNDGFVCIKVDRQERPDVDAIYMQATQAMTGSGGWPMTCFLTPAQEAFYCGTYFPPQPRQGMPGFTQLLEAITDTWARKRDQITEVAGQVSERLRAAADVAVGAATVGEQTPALLAHAQTQIAAGEDRVHGGFGDAPKFPPTTVLEFLARRGWDGTGEDAAAAQQLVNRTLAAMARSGMADQLGGGFARYSVDAGWVVPHFEKMLYDNALLLRLYALAAVAPNRAVGPDGVGVDYRAEFARVARGTAQFLLRDLSTDNGLFASALDADTDGVEGATYVWMPAQLREVVGADDGTWAAEVFGVTEPGTFEHGSSTLRLRADVDDDPRVRERFARVRSALLDARGDRPQPACDDLVVAGWNGLTLGALATAGVLLAEPDWVRAAIRGAHELVRVHEVAPGVLMRPSRNGSAGQARGLLEDYAFAAQGMLAVYAATGERFAVDAARRWLDAVLARFTRSGAAEGEFADTDADAPQLLVRSAEVSDNATPAGRYVAADALLAVASLTGSARYAEAGQRACSTALQVADRAPQAVGWGLAVVQSMLAGPVQVATVGAAGDPARGALLERALARPGAAVAVGDPSVEPVVELLDRRPLVDGQAAAYVCRGFVCDLPVTSPNELTRLLRA